MSILLARVIMISGAYFIVLSFLTTTRDLVNAIVYNILPFFLGVANILIALNFLGVITLKL